MHHAKQSLTNAIILTIAIMIPAAWGQDGAQSAQLDNKADAAKATTTTNTVTSKARSAELELAVDAIHLAIEKAKLRITQHRFVEAANLAQAGLKLVNRLPNMISRSELNEPLIDVLVEARTALRLPCNHDKRVDNHEGLGHVLDNAFPTKGVGRGELAPIETGDMIAHMGENPQIVSDTVLYPTDWPDRVANRKQKDEGILYKGPAFEDDQGKVKQTIIYDVQSLIFPMPVIFDIPTMDLRAMTRNAADRAALRETSEIFTGFARELDAGVDVLPYYGGVGTWSSAPDSSSDEQYRELIRLINLVIEEN